MLELQRVRRNALASIPQIQNTALVATTLKTTAKLSATTWSLMDPAGRKRPACGTTACQKSVRSSLPPNSGCQLQPLLPSACPSSEGPSQPCPNDMVRSRNGAPGFI